MNADVRIECSCRRRPLLAMGGVDDEGLLYAEIRATKGREVIVEVQVTGGTLRIRCRDCLRTSIIILDGQGRPRAKWVESTIPTGRYGRRVEGA